MKRVTRILNTTIFSFEGIKVNRLSIALTIIGLVLAFNIITFTVIYVEIKQNMIVQDILWPVQGTERYLANPDCSFEFVVRHSIGFQEIHELTQTTFTKTEYLDRIDRYFLYISTEYGYSTSYFDQQSRIASYAFINSNDVTSLILSSLVAGQLPQNESEVILYRNLTMLNRADQTNLTLLSVGDIITVTQPDSPDLSRINVTLTISGIIDDSGRNQDLQLFTGIKATDKAVLLTRDVYLCSIISELSSKSNATPLPIFGQMNFFLNQTSFQYHTLPEESFKLSTFILALSQEWKTKYLESSYSYGISLRISDAIDSVHIYLFTLLLLSSPLILISLYLAVNSFGHVQQKKFEAIRMFKLRGASRFQIILNLTIEILIVTILASFLSSVFNLFYFCLFFQNSSFFYAVILVESRIFVVGSLVVLGVNFRTIINLAQIDPILTFEDNILSHPFWKRFNLDFILFGLGIGGYLLIIVLTRSLGYNQLQYVQRGLGFPIPMLILVGSIMLFTRTLPYFIDFLGSFFWRVERGIIALSFLNLKRYRKLINQTILILTLAFTYTLVCSALILSNEANIVTSSYYYFGSDLKIENIEKNASTFELNSSFISYLQTNISEVEALTITRSIEKRFMTIGSGKWTQIVYFFIDPATFQAVIDIPAAYYQLSESLNALLQRIKDNRSIIVHKDSLNHHNLRIDDLLSLQNPNATAAAEGKFEVITYNFSIVGSFRYWPTIFPFTSPSLDEVFAPDSIYIVSSLETFETLVNIDFIDIYNYYSSPQASLYIKLKPHVNISETIFKIQANSVVDISTPITLIDSQLTSVENIVLREIIQINIIWGIFVSIISLSLFTLYILKEKTLSSDINRTLGMKRRLLLFSLFFETGMVMLFSVGFGLIFGTFYTFLILSILLLGSSFPPPYVVFPFDIILPLAIIITSFSIFSCIIPIFQITNRDLSHTLKEE